MENKPERVLISAMVDPTKPDPLEVLHQIKSSLEGLPGVSSVTIEQIGLVPLPAIHDSFERELEGLLNARSLENESMTPDFVLAAYLRDCLNVWNVHTRERDRWWGHQPIIGGSTKEDGAQRDAANEATLR